MNEEPLYNRLNAIGDRHLKSYVRGDYSNVRMLKELASQVAPAVAAQERAYGNRGFHMSKDERALFANEVLPVVRENMDYRLKKDYNFDPQTASLAEREFVAKEIKREEKIAKEKIGHDKLKKHFLVYPHTPLNPTEYSDARYHRRRCPIWDSNRRRCKTSQGTSLFSQNQTSLRI